MGGAVALRSPPAGAGALSNKQTSYEKYASAWFKNYGGTSHSGFYRIWDLMMNTLTETRKNEFLQIVKTIRTRLVL
jgi:hypothetical protein